MITQEITQKISDEKLNGVEVSKPFYKNILGLPDYFKFGFEIEALMEHLPLIRDMEEYTKKTLFNNNTFSGKEESTIEFEQNQYGGLDYSIGAEIVTPILSDSEETWRDILLACKYLDEHAECVENCSVHINVGAQALGNNFKNWYNFLKIIAACEPEIFRFFANGDKIRTHAISGGFRNSYALPVAEEIRQGLKKCDEEKVDDINTMLNYCSFNGGYQTRKDKSISFKDLYLNDNDLISPENLDEPAYGRRIEIRMPNGTFDANLIQYFTLFSSRLFEIARNLTPEQEIKLNKLLEHKLPENYNMPIDVSRVLDVANLLFNTKEDKLQFLYTTCGYDKVEKKLNYKSEIIDLIHQGNMVLELISDELKLDREIVLEAVKHGGGELEYASKEFRDDDEIVLAAVQKYGRSLQFASPRLQSDRKIVEQAVKSNGYALQFAGEELTNKRDIAFEAVKSKSYAIQYIGDALKSDKEIAIEAVKKDGVTLQFLNQDLKTDKDIAITAVKNSKRAASFMDEKTLLDKDILLIVYSRVDHMLEILNTGITSNEKDFIKYATIDDVVYKYLLKEVLEGNKSLEDYLLKILIEYKNESENFENRDKLERYEAAKEYITEKVNNEDNEDLILKILEIDGDALKFLSEEKRKNPIYVMAAIKSNSLALRYASNEFRKDKRIVLEALKNSYEYGFLNLIDKELYEDKEVAIELVKKEPRFLARLKDEFKDNKEIVLPAIRKDGYVITYASERLKDDKEIGLEIVSNNGYLLNYLSNRLKADKEIVLTALKNDRSSIEYASPELRIKEEELLKEIKEEKDDEIER